MMNLGLNLKSTLPNRNHKEVSSRKELEYDLHPLNNDTDFSTQKRHSSAVHFRIFPAVMLCGIYYYF